MGNLSTKFVEWLDRNTGYYNIPNGSCYLDGYTKVYYYIDPKYQTNVPKTLDELYNIFFEEEKSNPSSEVWTNNDLNDD